jgi:egghead protein (zeste-white 4 protein)
MRDLRPRDIRLYPSLLSFLTILAVVTTITLWLTYPHGDALNVYLTVIWSSYFPLVAIGLAGAIANGKVMASRYTGRTAKKVIFLLPTVARADVLGALDRVVDSVLQNAPRNLANWRIEVLVSEGSYGIPHLLERYASHPNFRLVVCPAAYGTPKHTLHKARAQHWVTQEHIAAGEGGPETWIYHLDDDTGVGPDTVASIAEVIEQGRYLLAQGVLTYPHQLSTNFFCRLADSVRPADDLTRFAFFNGLVHSPLVGVHGEHLLVRADVESRIGWDFGPTVTVEDAYFGLTFAKLYRGRSTFLPSCSYGASPATVLDLIRQRRRWCGGLISLMFDRSLSGPGRAVLTYSILNWASAAFQHIGVVLLVAWVTGAFNTSPVWSWVALIWGVNMTYQFWLYIEGLKLNLRVSRLEHRFPRYCALVVAGIWCFSAIEATAGILGFWDFVRRDHSFVVIAKPA